MANTLNFGAGKWAAKAGSVLAYNSENNNYKPLPFTFTRASTATRVNESGLIESVASGVPRIDYLNNADGHLLLEPSRTNIIPRSEDLDIGWSKLNVTIANNSIVSPNGSVSAGLVTVTSTNAQHADYDTFAASTTPSVAHYISCFVKKSTTRYIRLNEGYSGATLNFDLDNGTIVSLSGGASNSIVQNFGNGWYRIGFQFTSNATGDLQFALYLNDNNNTNAYAGAGEAVYLWGAQIELGSYATSYIPTSGSSVTRVDEIVGQTPVSGIVGQTEGAFFVEFEDLNYSYTSIARIIAFSDGTSTNRIYLAQLASGAMYVISTSGCEIQESAPSGRRGVLKVAVSYSLNNYKLYINGVLVGTDTSATVPVCNRFYLGGENGASTGVYKPYKEVKVFNTALSDAELIALTSN